MSKSISVLKLVESAVCQLSNTIKNVRYTNFPRANQILQLD